MKKMYRYLLMTVLALCLSIPAIGAEAASVALVPLINNVQGDEIANQIFYKSAIGTINAQQGYTIVDNDQITAIMSLGGIGIISVLSNIAPKVMHDICELYLNGYTQAAAELHLKHIGLMNAMFCDVNPIPVKEAMNMLNMNAGPCRMPLYPTSEANKQLIKQKLNECGFNF